MLLSLALPATHPNTQSSADHLAVVARFYKPRKAASRFELYLDGEFGGKRRLLSMPKEPHRAVWASPFALLVQTDLGWYLGNVKSWKPKLIKDSGDYNLIESRNRTWKPGEPEFSIDEKPGYFIFDPAASQFKTQKISTNHDVKLAEEGPTDIDEPNGSKLKVEPFQSFSYHARSKEVESEYEFQRAWRDNNRLFVMTGTHSSTSGSINSLLLFEKSQPPRTLISEANNIDFHESRGYFAYCTPRTTSPLDPKNPNSIQVWSSELVAGNWLSQTTPQKRLYIGAVHVASVSIRP
ncbi:MAG: hypothetical protein WCK51_01680 [Armatimonadota bacterium]